MGDTLILAIPAGSRVDAIPLKGLPHLLQSLAEGR